MKAINKLELKLKIRLIVMTVLILTPIFAVAFIIGKEIETVFYCIAHYVLRPKFEKQYHLKSTELCVSLSIGIGFIGAIYTLPLSISIISSIPLAFLVCWIGYIVQDRVDLAIYNKKLEVKIEALFANLKEKKQTDIYSMTEAELRTYAQRKGLNEMIIDSLVMRVIQNMRWVDIQQERAYSKGGMRYHKEQILDKLEIDKI